MIHKATTILGEPTPIAGLNIVVDLSDDGDVLLEIETQDLPHSDATVLKEFARFHTAHPDVLDEFLDTCRRKLDQGNRPRARQVLVHVRRQRFRQYGRGFLPLKNQCSAYYAALTLTTKKHGTQFLDRAGAVCREPQIRSSRMSSHVAIIPTAIDSNNLCAPGIGPEALPPWLWMQGGRR